MKILLTFLLTLTTLGAIERNEALEFWIEGYLVDFARALQEMNNSEKIVLEGKIDQESKKRRRYEISNPQVIENISEIIFQDSKECLRQSMKVSEEGEVSGTWKMQTSTPPSIIIYFESEYFKYMLAKYPHNWELYTKDKFLEKGRFYIKRPAGQNLQNEILKLIQQGVSRNSETLRAS